MRVGGYGERSTPLSDWWRAFAHVIGRVRPETGDAAKRGTAARNRLVPGRFVFVGLTRRSRD
ncbi:hypothetical protein GGQ82_003286 [Sphingobium olei]|nr:hypothetical protein [Sphingobium sp.]